MKNTILLIKDLTNFKNKKRFSIKLVRISFKTLYFLSSKTQKIINLHKKKF